MIMRPHRSTTEDPEPEPAPDPEPDDDGGEDAE
jgi:hypothetical protein